MTTFSPTFEAARAREALQKTSRIHIRNPVSDADARTLLHAMTQADWRLVFQDGEMVYDASAADLTALDVGRQTRLLERVHDVGREGFQFLYDSFRINNAVAEGKPCPPAFADFHRALNSEAWLGAFRALTGDDRINLVDAQATRFRPGHFLTAHHDHQPNSGRLYAYVMNLSETWRIDWGGLLMFHRDDGHVNGALAPRWNALNIFTVPQEHSVSMVTPLAQLDRLSITGWLRMAP